MELFIAGMNFFSIGSMLRGDGEKEFSAIGENFPELISSFPESSGRMEKIFL